MAKKEIETRTKEELEALGYEFTTLANFCEKSGLDPDKARNVIETKYFKFERFTETAHKLSANPNSDDDLKGLFE